MTQEEIIEGNKLIAVFMGGVIRKGLKYEVVMNEDDPKCPYVSERVLKLRYHSSFDWLMPVVDKIAKMKYRVKINSNHIDTSVIIQGVEDSESVLNIMYYSNPIEAVHTAVVQFIKWFNEQPK